MKDADVLMKFLRMPLGSSTAVFNEFARLDGAILRGKAPARFLYIRGTRADRVLLVAHADTVWTPPVEDSPVASPAQDVYLEEGVIQNRHGGLGADDRAGCAILWLLRNSGHSILITDGEECGLRGSSFLMAENPDIANDINREHQFCVQFDRRNSRDFKCYSVGTDKFRSYIGKITGYEEPDRHSCTDIVELCRDICGVNFSIGYYREHSEREYLVLDEWKDTLRICRKWLKQTGIPRFSL